MKVGLVYSMSGFRSSKEKASLEGALLAIHEINLRGGVNGKQIQAIIRDGKSNWKTTSQEIEDLILNEKVEAVFGGWSKANVLVKDLIEKHKHFLIYPFQYEGIINSPNVLWVGTSLNQQVSPTIAYCLKHIGNKFYLIGSEYLAAHTINLLARDQLQALGGEVLGERYLPFENESPNNESLDSIIQDIISKQPDVILSSIIDKGNYQFFNKLSSAGITAERIPTFSFSLNEIFLQEAGNENLGPIIGNFATWNYFESIDSPLNKQFVLDFQTFSHLTALDNSVEASYLGVRLWAKAANEAGTTNPQALRYILAGMRINAPEGLVTVDTEGLRAWKHSRIGKVLANGQFELVWTSQSQIRPIPFQIHHSKIEWDQLTETLKTYSLDPMQGIKEGHE
ncbi:MAG: transporter substrate-binding protein [Candidatus Protochlamydia sp.]|nr:transporter substrate-binding protein [Candidatus Protochlamydia sp.]